MEPRDRVTNQRGVALISALFGVLLLSGLCIMILDMTRVEVPVAFQQRDHMQVLYLADAGIEQAEAQLNRNLDADANKTNFNAELSLNGGYLYGAAYGGGGTPAGVDFTSNGLLVGQYRVQVVNNVGTTYGFPPDAAGSSPTNDIDQRVYVISEGSQTIQGQVVTKRIEALFAPGSKLPAFTAGGCPNSLAISGNPKILGSEGGVYSKCNATISGGSFSISQNLTASGENRIPADKKRLVQGEVVNNVHPLTIPVIQLSEYRKPTYLRGDDLAGASKGDYIMKVALDASGNILATVERITSWDPTGMVPSTVTVAGPSGSLEWPKSSAGWKFTGGASGTWDYQGDNVPDELKNRAFFIERASPKQSVHHGSATIPSNPGSPGAPWAMTLFADGHINISGDPSLQATDHSGNFQFVAGTDVALGGSPKAVPSTGGIIAAHEQIKLNGNGQFVGMFIAEDAENNDPFVMATEISGDPVITYDGNPATPLSWGREMVRKTWRIVP